MKTKVILISFTFLLVHSFASYAATYWVRPSGTMSGCTASATPPATNAGYKSTIVAGLSCLASGDTLYIRAGTYNERLNNGTSNIPGGSSWATATTISGYTGETVTIMPTAQIPSAVLLMSHPSTLGGQVNEWIIWQDLIFDGSNVDSGGGNTVTISQSHNRFSRVEVRNNGLNSTDHWIGAAVSVGGQAGAPVIGFEFTHGSVHDNGLIASAECGNDAPYGFYDSRTIDTIIEYSSIYRNGCYGIHGYSGAGDHQSATYRYNTVYDNQLTALNQGAVQILARSGDKHKIYGNVVYYTQTARPPLAGIEIGGDGGIVANNTVYNSPDAGIRTHPTCSSCVVRNNIVVKSNTNNVGAVNIENNGSSTTLSNNLCYDTGGTTNCQITGQDPLFVSTSTPNFRLTSTSSPAYNAGFDMSGTFTTDLAGTTRPQAATFDIGAYEFVSSPLPGLVVTAPTNNSTVNAATLNVTGTTTNSATSVTWVCDRCTPATGTAGGTASWSINGLTLKAGINVLQITATNANGSTASTLTTTYAPSFPGNSLVLAFGFDEGSGATTADASGNSNNGILINSPTWAGASGGRYGNALVFNGTNQALNVPDSNSLDLTQSFTLSVWVKPAVVSTTYASILAKASGSPYRLFASVEGECGSGAVSGFVRSNGASGPQDQACYVTPLPVGTWTHVAVTYDGTNVKLYTQGVLRVTQVHSGYMEASTGVLYVAASEFGEYFQGVLDNLRVYNFALPLTGGANTTPNVSCQSASDQTAIATASIVGSMNCPVTPLAPPITFKVGAATTLKLSASSTTKIGSVPQ